MFNVKVKTLDGEDQLIEFKDHMTVLNLKEKIQERLNISTDNQRLIYCGRILQDEKKLTEYDLDGKVIHLVDTPPNLNANQSANATTNNPSSHLFDSNQETTNSHFSIDINLNGANVHQNAESRVSSLTRILGFINRAIDKLEQDPNLPSPSYEQSFEATSNDPLNSNNNSSDNIQSLSSVPQVGILALGNDLPTRLPNQPSQNLFDLNQISMDITNFLFNSNGRNSGNIIATNSNSTLTSTTTNDESSTANNASSTTNNASSTSNNASSTSTNQQQPQSSAAVSLGSLIGSLTQGLIGSSLGSLTSSVPLSGISMQTSSQNRTSSNTNANSSSTATNLNNSQPNSATALAARTTRRVTWAEYANLLDQVKQAQERFSPHVNSFQQSLLQRHGSLTSQQAEDEQTKYRIVARCMHHLSHVYHMLSDFYVNYTHQQDQTIQVFEPLVISPMRRTTTEVRMTTGPINLGGSTNNLANNVNSNAQRSNGPQVNESPLRNTSTPGSTSRRDFTFLLSGNPGQQRTSSSANPEANSSRTGNNLFQNMFGASLPNLSNSNLTINGQQQQPNPATTNSSSNLTPNSIVIQTIGLGGPNRILSQQTSNVNRNMTNQQIASIFMPEFESTFQRLLGESDQQQQSRTVLTGRSSEHGQASRTTHRNENEPINPSNPTNQQQPHADSAASSSANNQTNNQSNNINLQPLRTSQRIRTGQQPGFHSHIYNFDPHLQCSSNWLIPDVRGRLEIDFQVPNLDQLIRSAHNQSATNASNSTQNSNQANNASTIRTRVSSNSDIRSTSNQQSNSNLDLESLELLNEIKKLFSNYLAKEELLKRIDRLPKTANNSLSSFIDSMNILNEMSRDTSNITLELFMILAQKISVSEFLKIIFMRDFKCLNRAQDSMVNYARTNLLFNNEEPFDFSGCVDELIKKWKKVLSTSFNEFEFSERTFSALMSELRANLSVFLRTFTRNFNNENESSSFASTLYFAIRRLFIDFHTSLSQMFRSPNNVMRAYRNILIQIFPNSQIRSIIIGILSYRIPSIDESERSALKPTRFRERVLKLTDHQTQSSNSSDSSCSSNNCLFNQTATSSNAASSSSTPMEIDFDADYDINYGSESWHFNCPRNWIKVLKQDREKIFKNKQNTINSGLRFSSIYKQAYKN